MELKRFGDFVKESVNGIDDLGMKTPFSRLRLPMVKKAKGLASLRVALSWVYVVLPSLHWLFFPNVFGR